MVDSTSFLFNEFDRDNDVDTDGIVMEKYRKEARSGAEPEPEPEEWTILHSQNRWDHLYCCTV